MPNINTLPAVFAWVFLTGCAGHLQTQTGQATAFSAQGWGGAYCQTLINDITPRQAGFNQAMKNIRLYESWASGFISGVNYADHSVYDVSGESTPEEIFAWLKNHCQQHPQTAVPLALHRLMNIWRQQGRALVKAREK